MEGKIFRVDEVFENREKKVIVYFHQRKKLHIGPEH